MIKIFSKLLDIRAIIIFFGSFLLLHFINMFWIGLTVPGGSTYSQFVCHYINYPDWLKNSILFSANAFSHFIGVESYRSGIASIEVLNGRGIVMAYSCYGLDLISLWLAFIIADDLKIKRKIVWAGTGIAAIWLINVLRVALLLFTQNKRWNFTLPIDHHTVFNLTSYSVILLLIVLYYSTKKVTLQM